MNFFETQYALTNSSMCVLPGQTFIGIIKDPKASRAFVDLGWKSALNCLPNEVLPTRIQDSITQQNPNIKTQPCKCRVVLKSVKIINNEPNVILPFKVPFIRVVKKLKFKRRVRGLLLNKVKSGFCVGIAGRSAFLPKSLYKRQTITQHINQMSWFVMLKKKA